MFFLVDCFFFSVCFFSTYDVLGFMCQNLIVHVYKIIFQPAVIS